MRNQMREQIKQAFDEDGIEIPFPHLSIYKGSETDPIPGQVVERPFI
ncbi:MAG: mechanosensitive ion channel family protein [Acidobacteriota bacterium]